MWCCAEYKPLSFTSLYCKSSTVRTPNAHRITFVILLALPAGGERAARFDLWQLVLGTRRAMQRVTNDDPQEMVNCLVDGAAAGQLSVVVAMLTQGADPNSAEGDMSRALVPPTTSDAHRCTRAHEAALVCASPFLSSPRAAIPQTTSRQRRRRSSRATLVRWPFTPR